MTVADGVGVADADGVAVAVAVTVAVGVEVGPQEKCAVRKVSIPALIVVEAEYISPISHSIGSPVP